MIARSVALAGRGPGEMAYLDFGPPERPVDVIFTHANGFNARTYLSVLEPLADLRILAVDQRGHGRSTLAAGGDHRGWALYGEDLAAFVRVMATAPVVLSGHSMGGAASILAAAIAPEHVRALALFDPVLLAPGPGDPPDAMPKTESALVAASRRRRTSFPDRDAAFAAYHGRGAFRTWTDGQLRDYLADGLREAPGGQVVLACDPAWEADNFVIGGFDPRVALAAAHCPVRVLRGETNSTARAHVLAEAGLTAHTVPGTTHFLPLERPDLVQATLREMTA